MQKDVRRRDIGLGGYPKLNLAAARKMAETVIEQIVQGIDPVAAQATVSTSPTFAKASKARHNTLVPSYRNAKHAAQWLTSLETYAWPEPGSLPVDSVIHTLCAGRAAAVDAFTRAKLYRREVEPGQPDLVFPSPHKGGPLSDMALTKLLCDLGAGARHRVQDGSRLSARGTL